MPTHESHRFLRLQDALRQLTDDNTKAKTSNIWYGRIFVSQSDLVTRGLSKAKALPPNLTISVGASGARWQKKDTLTIPLPQHNKINVVFKNIKCWRLERWLSSCRGLNHPQPAALNHLIASAPKDPMPPLAFTGPALYVYWCLSKDIRSPEPELQTAVGYHHMGGCWELNLGSL